MSSPAILYVHDLRGSGVVTNAIALARKLGATRETILCAGYGKGLNLAVDVAPARLVVLDQGPEPSRARMAAARNLRRLIGSSRAGLVVSMGNFGHQTVFLATMLTRIHTVYRVSNEIGRPQANLRNFRRRSWQKLLLATADAIVLVGRALAELPLFADAVRTGRAVYIPNGIDLDRASRGALAPAPHPWLSDGGPPVVLTIGRIHVQKNLEGLIEGAALAARQRPLRLVILGTGPNELRARLARLADDKGVDLLFAGETNNVFAWLARVRLFALVSHWEGSSTALLEAMALNLPVVASRQAGDAAHVLDDGRYGCLVDANDPASIAAGIVAQIDRPTRPGTRVDQFRLERTHQLYTDVLQAL